MRTTSFFMAIFTPNRMTQAKTQNRLKITTECRVCKSVLEKRWHQDGSGALGGSSARIQQAEEYRSPNARSPREAARRTDRSEENQTKELLIPARYPSQNLKTLLPGRCKVDKLEDCVVWIGWYSNLSDFKLSIEALVCYKTCVAVICYWFYPIYWPYLDTNSLKEGTTEAILFINYHIFYFTYIN